MKVVERVKFPKTFHVPWSTGTSDDKTLETDSHMEGMDVVVTLKMDGENTTISKDFIHARSLYDPVHPSQTWVKQLRGNIAYRMWDERLHGENLYAKHTVEYDELPSYFMLFGVSIEDQYLDWQDVKDHAEYFDLVTVPAIYEGKYDAKAIEKAYEPYRAKHEGYVIRNSKQFPLSEYNTNVAKYVNPGFRQALKENNVHWATAPVVPNKLKVDE